MSAIPPPEGAPEAPGVQEPQPDSLLGMNLKNAVDTMSDAVNRIDTALQSGAQINARVMSSDATPREITLNQGDEKTQEIVAKVLPFLDTSMRGPIFIAVVRHKLFVGLFPRHNQLIDVETLTDTKPNQMPSVAQIKLSMLGELVKSLQGWVPEAAPEAAMLRATLHEPDKWPKLQPINWLDTRDPFIFDEEIEPLFEKYTAWKAAVSPTKEELDFYYSLMR